MWLSSLDLTNFRGFRELHVDFDQELTVLAGPNGSGKSNILRAVDLVIDGLRLALGAPISAPTRLDDVRYVKAEGGVVDRQWPVRLRAEVRSSSHKYTLEASGLTPSEWDSEATNIAQNAAHHLRSNNDDPTRTEPGDLPMMTSYGPRRFAEPASRVSYDEVMNRAPERIADGYGSTGTDSLAGVRTALAREQLISLQRSKPTETLAAVRRSVASILDGSPALEFDVEQSDVVLDFHGKKTRLSDASDGQRALVLLAVDLTVRAHRLNPHHGADAASRANGIVTIDEVELHLHPLWQRSILRSLRLAFPGLQFIVSTHSPQVLGEVEPDKVRLLEAHEIVTPDQTVGMDSGWIVRHVMGGASRSPEYDSQIQAARVALHERDFRRARELIDALTAEIGADPEIQSLRSRIDKLELLAR